MENLIPAYIEAVSQEIQWISRSSGQRLPVHTIYFGGGTPSLIPTKTFVNLIEHIYDYFSVSVDAEISMEANPGTVSFAALQAIHDCGVNRLSLGMQVTQDRLLQVLGRIHTVAETDQAVEAVRQAGFEQLNLDLIYGIPTQTIEDWVESLEHALTYQPEHLSLYALTLESGLLLEKRIQRGELPQLDDDQAAVMYEEAENSLARAGYEHYEISNWAMADGRHKHRCRHNLQIWENGDYLGIGAGAHGKIGDVRIANTSSIVDYISSVNNKKDSDFPLSPALDSIEHLSKREVMDETMLLGLRLTESGVSERKFQERFDISYHQIYNMQIGTLLAKGLVESVSQGNDVRLRLSKKGRLLGNQVFMEFI